MRAAGDSWLLAIAPERPACEAALGGLATMGSGAPDVVRVAPALTNARVEIFSSGTLAEYESASLDPVLPIIARATDVIRMGLLFDVDGELRIETELLAQDPNRYRELATALRTPRLALAPLPVPEADFFLALECDPTALLPAIRGLVSPETQRGLDDMLAAAMGVAGIDIEGQLLPNLTGRILWGTADLDIAGLIEEDLDALAHAMGVLAVEVRNPAPFVELFESIETLLPPNTVDYDGDGDEVSVQLGPLAGIDAEVRLQGKWLCVGQAGRIDDFHRRAGQAPEDGALDPVTRATAEGFLGRGPIIAWDPIVLLDTAAETALNISQSLAWAAKSDEDTDEAREKWQELTQGVRRILSGDSPSLVTYSVESGTIVSTVIIR